MVRQPLPALNRRRISAEHQQLTLVEQSAIHQRAARRGQVAGIRGVVLLDYLGQIAGRIFSRAPNKRLRQKIAHRAVTGEVAAENFPRHSAPVLLRDINAQRKRRRHMRDQRKPQPLLEIRRGNERELVRPVQPRGPPMSQVRPVVIFRRVHQRIISPAAVGLGDVAFILGEGI